VQIVIFDSAADVGRGGAVYVTAIARQVDAPDSTPSARKHSGPWSARRFQPAELSRRRGHPVVRRAGEFMGG
jgi:hypothetical protein